MGTCCLMGTKFHFEVMKNSGDCHVCTHVNVLNAAEQYTQNS